ncbi:MAG: primosomal protein N' [Xanthomonadaceae bacterium]|jgi:primosomal protein N' (replication factor Y)|nr:primosomal protein N' [Xanthomonadaceae bacterium]
MAQVLRVAVPVPLPRVFDYRAPDAAPPREPVGCRVVVPFGRRRVVGVVVAVAESVSDDAELRAAEAWLDAASPFGAELWSSLHWAAQYWAHPLGEVLATALPVALRQPEPMALPQARAFALAAPVDETRARTRAGSQPRRVVDALAAGPLDGDALDAQVPGASRVLSDLRARGLVIEVAPTAAPAVARPGPALSDEQRDAAAAILAQDGFAAFLLEGVTGSGKTEVYLAAIAQALARGRQCLVLVPEIGLTPQAIARYRARLGVPVAALHSGLGDGERAAAWLACARGEAPLVIGTRSAVFTPLARPGLIVVDEEHDGSYKQIEGFRYHARDLALVRARALGVPVVLGSATPSLESLANVAAGRYRLLRLTHRAAGARAPSVEVVDLRGARLDDGLSPRALAAIGETLSRGEQVLVFRNRRGFAPVLLCHACGWHAECPRCDHPMTLHAADAALRCHHCGYQQRRPADCPACHDRGLLPVGVGTERLEAALARRFPEHTVLRVDRDSMRRRGAFDALLERLGDGRPALLVGTQMLAKGHDLPRLTLVVLADVDGGLFSPDFRAPERLAQLVVQVAGRAGRADRAGRVLLQTHQPDHPLLARLLSGGYPAFATAELDERRALGLPPFAAHALLRAEAREKPALDGFLGAARGLFADAPEVAARGPLPAPMPRRAGLLRAQLVLECPRRGGLQAAIAARLDALYALPGARSVRWSLDVDPLDLG